MRRIYDLTTKHESYNSFAFFNQESVCLVFKMNEIHFKLIFKSKIETFILL